MRFATHLEREGWCVLVAVWEKTLTRVLLTLDTDTYVYTLLLLPTYVRHMQKFFESHCGDCIACEEGRNFRLEEKMEMPVVVVVVVVVGAIPFTYTYLTYTHT